MDWEKSQNPPCMDHGTSLVSESSVFCLIFSIFLRSQTVVHRSGLLPEDHRCSSWTAFLGNDSFNSHVRRRNLEFTAFKSGPCLPPYMLVILLGPKIKPWPLLLFPEYCPLQQRGSALSSMEWRILSPDCKTLLRNGLRLQRDDGNSHRWGYREPAHTSMLKSTSGFRFTLAQNPTTSLY